MAGITLEQAEAQLTTWLSASTAVSKNQSYSIAGRAYSRTDAKEIRENIKFWNDMVNELSDNQGIIVSQLVPTDD